MGVIMKKRGFLSLSFLCLFSIMFAMPYSTMGNINIPEAYILPHKMVDLSFTNYFIGGGLIEGDVGTIKDNLYDVSGSVRFGLFNRAEVGIVYTSTTGVFGNLKIRIINETDKLPVISFGITLRLKPMRTCGILIMIMLPMLNTLIVKIILVTHHF